MAYGRPLALTAASASNLAFVPGYQQFSWRTVAPETRLMNCSPRFCAAPLQVWVAAPAQADVSCLAAIRRCFEAGSIVGVASRILKGRAKTGAGFLHIAGQDAHPMARFGEMLNHRRTDQAGGPKDKNVHFVAILWKIKRCSSGVVCKRTVEDTGFHGELLAGYWSRRGAALASSRPACACSARAATNSWVFSST